MKLHRPLRSALVAGAGVATALGIAGLTQSASGQSGTSTTATTTATSTSTTPTTTAPRPAPRASRRTISCRARLYATRPPVSTALEFATLSCGRPLGKGVQHNRATVTANAQRTEGTFSGSIKLYFNEGALRGTFRTRFTVQNATASYDGTIRITSGTGDLRGVRGSGTIRGTSTDGLTASLRERLRLAFPAASR